jgi:hypothetical protein
MHTFLRNQLGATPTASHNDVRPLVRDCESCSQHRPHTTFRNRKAGCDERSQPATARRRIGPPFQFQPGLTYVLPGRARSPPCVPPLSTGKPQRNLRLRRCSTADHHMYHWRRVHGTGEAPTNPHLPYPLRATTLPAIGTSDTRLLRLAFLSPRTVRHILDGKQPVSATVRMLTKVHELPTSWAEQETLLASFD